MAKRWKKAVVTYNGGLSYEFRGTRFRQGRSVQVNNESLAKALDGRKGFSVQHEFVEVADAPSAPAPVAKPVKKTKRAADAD
jgi:hypothetical protein